MQLIDWILVAIPVLLVAAFAIYTKRFTRGVADFVAGGRCAGRYLICNARGEAASGVANTASKFEVIMVSGFTLAFWEKLSVPILLVVGISGFVIYRYRETRALTLGQFFEMRYSRAFRLFMGGLAFLSGILNYGIFPAVSSRFIVYFVGLPTHVSLAGFDVSTHIVIMAMYLTASLAMLLVGGQITLMVTDCVEGVLSQIIYVVIIVIVFVTVSWSQMVTVLSSTPPQQSMIDPFDAQKVADFNVWYVVMSVILSIYGTMALQNSHGFNSAARTPHESRMAGVLGHWRGYARTLMLLVLTTAAVTYMRHPSFAEQSSGIGKAIAAIGDPQLQKQMTVPIVIRFLLPVGVKGMFLSLMILGLIAGDCGHMHSWGSILVQDLIVPLQKTPLSPKRHLLMLRLSCVFVAVFAFFFSIFFTQTHYIALWWQLTAAIFVSGGGAAIIGGLYWQRGSVGAAWTAVITGAVLSLGSILAGQFWTSITAAWGATFASIGFPLPDRFWFNGIQSAFITAVAASIAYILVSLIWRRQQVDLNKVLHRGQYAVAADQAKVRPKPKTLVGRILGFDEHFTRSDKWISAVIFGWSIASVALNLIITTWNAVFYHWPIAWWGHYWFFTGVFVPFVIAAITTVWFGIGGAKDIKLFFIALKNLKRDARDDGTVTDGPHPEMGDSHLHGAPEPAMVVAPVARPPIGPM